MKSTSIQFCVVFVSFLAVLPAAAAPAAPAPVCGNDAARAALNAHRAQYRLAPEDGVQVSRVKPQGEGAQPGTLLFEVDLRDEQGSTRRIITLRKSMPKQACVALSNIEVAASGD